MRCVRLLMLGAAVVCTCCAKPYQDADRVDLSYSVFHYSGPMTHVDVEVLDGAQASIIAAAITDQPPERTDCGASGTLSLYKDGSTVFDKPARINLHPDCAHIAFSIDGKTSTRVLAGEGLTVLRTLYADHVPAEKRVAY